MGNRLAADTGLDGFKPRRNSDVLELSRGLENGRKRRHQIGRSNGNAGMQIDQRIITRYRDQTDLAFFLCQLAKTLGKQRMILAQETAHHQRRIQILDLG